MNKKRRYFIYDDCNEILIKKLLKKHDYKIFNFRKLFNSKVKKIFYILKFIIQNILSIEKLKIIINDGFFIAFTLNEIKLFKPDFVITTSDNDLRFYLLKKYFDKSVKFVAIQNGARSKINDMFDNPLLTSKKNLSADYYCSFGQNLRDEINKFIKVKVIPIGSFKNNFSKIKINLKRYNHNNCLLYISSFRNIDKSEIFHISLSNKIIYWKEFLNEEIKLIKNLKKYCLQNGLKLSIAGSSLKFSEKEIKFYKKILGSCKWKYYYRDSIFSNYKLLDNFEIIISTCGTLGYEALGRNKRVAFFSRNFSPYKDWTYGWPEKLYPRGFFYSNVLSFNEINRVLNNLRSVRNSDWKSVLLNEKNRSMHFDYGNNKLKSLII